MKETSCLVEIEIRKKEESVHIVECTQWSDS